MSGCSFKRELKVFGEEASAAAQFLYGSLAVGTLANEDPEVRKRLNIAPPFWNTVHFSLKKSAILALGRIFETNTAHNAASVMREAGEIDIFTKDALRRRKHEQSANAAEWIEEFLARAYVPSHDDIRRLRKEVDKWRKIYDANYRPLRDKTFAHREVAQGTQELEVLIERTQMAELKHMCLFLIALNDALWQLYENGTEPIVCPIEHTVRELLSPENRGNSAPEIVVRQVREFLIGNQN